MAQKSGFFNARMIGGEYDRRYNANDYCDNLAVVISNGVLRSENDDLKVTASGMQTTVNLGRAWINGHYYFNDSPLPLAPVTAPQGGTRYDRVMLRMNNDVSVRTVSIIYVEGTPSNDPVKPAPTRNSTIYDLVLADVFVGTNATSVVVTDTRSDPALCGWVYSTSGDNSFFKTLDNDFNEWFDDRKDTLASVTLFKRYTWAKTLAAAATTVSFSIPQYDADTCFIEVYVNGILDTRYTLSGTTISFAGTLTAGTVVTVKCYKSIDGTGIMTVADEITELQNKVAALEGAENFVYKCTGLDDNISLSQIAQAFLSGSYTKADVTDAADAFLTALGGNTYLASLPADFQATIDVVGRLGATTPFAGSGTAASRYRWFSLGQNAVSDKKIIFDFARCEKIRIEPTLNNIIFFGTDLYVKNANVDVQSTTAGTAVAMIVGNSKFGRIQFTDCRLKVRTTSNAVIAENGEFTNCLMHTKSLSGNSYIFFCEVTECLARMNGGTAAAYVGDSSKNAAIFYISSAATNAVIAATNINCPTVAQSGYMQKNLAIANAGMIQIYNVVSTITSTGASANLNIQGQIWKSKY